MLLPQYPHIPALGSRDWSKRKYSHDGIAGFVVHSPGRGLYARWRRDNPKLVHEGLEPIAPPYSPSQAPKTWREWQATRGREFYPFDTAVRVYASIMREGAHFVVCGETGRAVQMGSLNLAAWHVGVSNASKYLRPHTVPRWWRGKFQAHDPRRVDPFARFWAGGSINHRSIGIEIAMPRAGADAPWTEAGMDGLYTLIQDVNGALGASLLPVVSHSEVHPVSRTLRDAATDPPESQWESYRKYAIERHLREIAVIADNFEWVSK